MRLPGDEKAKLPEDKGAPSPVTADQVKKADAAATPATAPPPKPKVTETPAQTGTGGPKGDEPATKPGRRAQPKANANGAEGQQRCRPKRLRQNLSARRKTPSDGRDT